MLGLCGCYTGNTTERSCRRNQLESGYRLYSVVRLCCAVKLLTHRESKIFSDCGSHFLTGKSQICALSHWLSACGGRADSPLQLAICQAQQWGIRS